MKRCFLLFLVISCISFVQCTKRYGDGSARIVIGNDSLFMFLKLKEDSYFSSDTYYYINKQRTMLYSIEITHYKSGDVSDTLEYTIGKDTIINETSGKLYIVKNNLIIAEKIMVHGNYFGYEYDTNRQLVRDGHLDKNGNIRNYLSKQYSWQNGRVVSGSFVYDHLYSIDYKYKDSGYIVNGGIGCYIWDFFDREHIPFIVLGYFGKIPEGNLCEVVYAANKKESIKRTYFDNEIEKGKFVRSFSIYRNYGNDNPYNFRPDVKFTFFP